MCPFFTMALEASINGFIGGARHGNSTCRSGTILDPGRAELFHLWKPDGPTPNYDNYAEWSWMVYTGYKFVCQIHEVSLQPEPAPTYMLWSKDCRHSAAKLAGNLKIGDQSVLHHLDRSQSFKCPRSEQPLHLPVDLWGEGKLDYSIHHWSKSVTPIV